MRLDSQYVHLHRLIGDSRQFLDIFFEHSPYAVAMFDREMRYLAASGRFKTDFGLGDRDIIGLSHYEVFPEIPDRWKEVHRRALAGSVEHGDEEPFHRADGRIDWVKWDIAPWREPSGEVGGIAMFTEVVTARKAAEDELRLLSAALDSAANAITVTDRGGKIIWVNRAFTELTGYTFDEAVNQNPRILKSGFHDREFYAELWQTILSDNVWRGEIINRRKDGTTYFEEQTITPLRDDSGEITKFIAIKLDITERKRAEERLLASEERYRQIVENAYDMIYSRDLEGNYTSINAAGERMTGYPREEFLGLNMEQLYAPEHIARAREAVEKELDGKKSATYEADIIHKDGTRRTFEVNVRLITRDGKPVGIQGVARDVTERRSLEAQFREAQKLETVGRLSAGIAHDFNNMLTAINGYSELILRSDSVNEKIRRNVEQIRAAGEKAAELTRQLLIYSRRQAVMPELVNINDVVLESAKLMQRLIGENISIRNVPDLNMGMVMLGTGQMHQILTNLIVNARDAMPEGGKIVIETADVIFDKRYFSGPSDLHSGRYASLSVTDNGVGMLPEIRDMIFEPFFTTKEEGKGTGLGLSTVFGIVKQYGGNISVYSEPGHGTTFKILFPVADGVAEAAPGDGSAATLGFGDERILLVEDEISLRELARDLLEMCGYRVVTAVDGVDALELIMNTDEHFDLMITDIVMPRMGGRELFERVRELRPELPVLFASGYPDEAVIQHGLVSRDVLFVQKPFTVDAVTRRIRDLLDQRGSPKK